MSDETPKPWLQGGAPPGVAKLLESAGNDGPSAAAFAKLSAKLVTAGLLAPGGPGGGGGHGGGHGGDGGGGAVHPPSHPAPHPATHAASHAAPHVASSASQVASTAASVAKPVALGAKMLLIGTVGVAAVGGGAFQAGRVVERRAQEARLAQAPPPPAPAPVVAAPTPPPPPPPVEEPEVVPEPVLPVVKPVVKPKPIEPVNPEQEAELLTQALAASKASQWEQALAAAEQHARRFPNGTLAQEREMIAIESLLKLSRRAEAEKRAERFRKQWPTSTHLVRLNSLLKE